MAQMVRLVDDVDKETDADDTVTFALGRQEYEIDLCEANADALKAELAWWIQFARKKGTAPKSLPKKAQHQHQSEPEPAPTDEWWRAPEGASQAEQERYHNMRIEIREWGLRNGWPTLGDRGRLPRALYAKWWSVHQRHRAVDPEDPPDTESGAEDDATTESANNASDTAPQFSHAARGAARKGTRKAPGRRRTVAGAA